MPKVLVVSVGKEPELRNIPAGLTAMQKVVGGYIEMVPLSEGVDLVCNEEGKLTGLPRNRYMERLQDFICGDFFISRREDGQAVDLTPGDVLHYSKEFSLKPAKKKVARG